MPHVLALARRVEPMTSARLARKTRPMAIVSATPEPALFGPRPRRASVAVRVGKGAGAVVVGGGAAIVVQSMTNTDTADVEATARRCSPSDARRRPVAIGLDATFDALTPAVGSDGGGRGSDRSGAAAATTGGTPV